MRLSPKILSINPHVDVHLRPEIHKCDLHKCDQRFAKENPVFPMNATNVTYISQMLKPIGIAKATKHSQMQFAPAQTPFAISKCEACHHFPPLQLRLVIHKCKLVLVFATHATPSKWNLNPKYSETGLKLTQASGIHSKHPHKSMNII